MTKMLHVCKPRRFQRTWIGVNRPSGCWVPASARFQEPLSHPWARPIMPPWANNHDVAHLQAKTVPKNLIWSESAQWLLSSGVHKNPEALITDSRSPHYAHGHTHMAPMGKWPWRCTSRGWGSSHELNLELIGPVIAEWWLGRTGGRTNGWRPFHSPIFFLQKGRGTMGKVGNKNSYIAMR